MPGVLALVLLLAFGSALAHREPRLTGTNDVPLRGAVVGLRQGEEVCQPGQLMPKDSARLQMHAATDAAGVPKMLVTVKQAQDGVVERARGRYHQELIDVPIDPPVRRTRVDAEVCVRNIGPQTFTLAGILTPYGNARLHGKTLGSAVTMLWYAKGEPSWIAQLGAIAPRVGHARMGGTWAFGVAAVLALSAFALALAAVIREARAEPRP